MERAAIIVAVVVAVMFAAAGAGAFNFHGMNLQFSGSAAPQVEVQAGKLAASTYAATELNVTNAAAILRISPEDRSDIILEIDNPGRAPMPLVRLSGNELVVDGRLQGRILNCRDDGGADLLGYGGIAPDQMPVITVRTPRAVDLDIDGAVTAEVGAADSVKIDRSGCGRATLADISGALNLDSSGSGEVTANAVGAGADVDMSGSGDVTLGAVTGGLKVDMAGSGSVVAASVNGELNVDKAGSGDVRVDGGALTLADIDIAGSGEVSAPNASAQSADIQIAGSGNVQLGAVGDLNVEIMGSGDVRIASVSGQNRQQIAGSGDVTIGGSALPRTVAQPAPPPPASAPPALPARPAPPAAPAP